jgi:hypothetical protein
VTGKKAQTRSTDNIPARLGLSALAPAPLRGANRLVRLEHQKTMLEKQLQVWLKRQALTEHRLRLVDAQINAVEASLRISQPTQAAKYPGPKPASLATTASRTKRRSNIAFTF